ncbi:MAG: YdgA family protein [Helicobacteraceae bacterium]|jgi:hypothetical protein|nr:YdgA family protein [Helicobacteraceae bacterium]
MKKFLIAAIVAFAIVVTALPISMGLVAQGYFASASDNLRARLPKQYEQIFGTLPVDLKLKSYEGGLFGAKALLEVVVGDNSSNALLIVESDVSYGWHFTKAFPYLHLVKAHTIVRLSKELRSAIPIPIFDEGKILEGDIYFTPKIAGSGVLATPAVSIGDILDAKPIIISYNYAIGENNSHIAIDWSSFSVVKESTQESGILEGVRLAIDGNVLDINDNAKLEFAIKKMSVADIMKLENLNIKSVQTIKGGAYNGLNEFSFDLFEANNTRKYTYYKIGKSFFSIASSNFDHKSLLKLRDLALSDDKNYWLDDKEKVSKEILPLLAKCAQNASITVKSTVRLGDKSWNLDATASLNPEVPFPDFTDIDAIDPKDLIKKAIVDLDWSAHEEIVKFFGSESNLNFDDLERLIGEGYFKRENGVISAKVHIENGVITINGKTPAELENWMDSI